jgi:hypothetical protein
MWTLMYIGPNISPRNIITYVRRAGQDPWEHRGWPYVPQPRWWPEEHKPRYHSVFNLSSQTHSLFTQRPSFGLRSDLCPGPGWRCPTSAPPRRQPCPSVPRPAPVAPHIGRPSRCRPHLPELKHREHVASSPTRSSHRAPRLRHPQSLGENRVMVLFSLEHGKGIVLLSLDLIFFNFFCRILPRQSAWI